MPGVARPVRRTGSRMPDTTDSPHFLGLDAPGGALVATRRGRQGRRRPRRRRDRHRHLAGEHRVRRRHGHPRARPTGTARARRGELWSKNTCNDKLIGARYYLEGFGSDERRHGRLLLARATAPATGRTPRRRRPATTARGRASTGTSIGTGSGMAPGAKVAMYKVCWEGRKDISGRLLQLRQRGRDQRRGRSTVSTSSTTRSAARRSRARSTRSRRPSAARPTPASSSPTPPATADPARARSTTRRRG